MLARLAATATPTLARATSQAAASGGLSMLARRSPALMASSQQRRTFVRIVRQGFEGYRLTLGRDPVHLEPGLRLAIPILHSTQVIDMREQSVDVERLLSFTHDNVPVNVSGSLFYQVKDAYRACFGVSEVAKNVLALGTSAVRSAVGRFAYDEIIQDRTRLNLALREIIGAGVDSWGVDCTRFEIQRFGPSNRDVERQLELQMEAERNRRKQILDTQALVNVAEGQKQSEMLRAEGHAAAITREAEARKAEAVLSAQGLADQIAAISEQLDGDKRTAVELLIQLQKLKQLQAIATGPSNSTYFLPQVDSMAAYQIDVMEKLKNRPSPPVKIEPTAAEQNDALKKLNDRPSPSAKVVTAAADQIEVLEQPKSRPSPAAVKTDAGSLGTAAALGFGAAALLAGAI